MDRLESKLIYTVLALMLVFTAMVVYANMSLGIHLPTHQEHVMPFTKGEVIPRDNNRFEVHYVAKMWAFDPPEVVLPENAEVDLYVSAKDVNHGLNIVGTDLNLMAVPGTVNAAHYRFRNKGEYMVVCHEYCGLNHQNMFSKIRIVSADEYAEWFHEMTEEVTTEGQKLGAEFECTTCHTIDGTEGLGPTFKGLYGKKEKLADGREIIVDDAYLFEAIKYPDKTIVAGHDVGSMPSSDMPDHEIQEIIEYIKTLK